MFKKVFSLVLTVLMICGSVLPVSADQATNPIDFTSLGNKLVILHTNDTHGRDYEGIYSTADVSQLKKDLEAKGLDVLLLSVGDATQGTPLVNLDNGASAIKFMNEAGYDAMTLGNHEFDWGVDNLNSLIEKAEFPVLASNIKKSDGSLAFLEYKIFEFSGFKVGVFGLATPETATKAHPDKVKGLIFEAEEKMYEAAKTTVKKLEDEGCDYIIALAHLGDADESIKNRSIDLLDNVDGIDLLIDGHSHTELVNGVVQNKTLRVSTGEYLDNIGLVTYDYSTKETKARLISYTVEEKEDGSEIYHKDYEGRDEDLYAMIKAQNDDVEEQLSQKFAVSEVLLDGNRAPGVRTQETNLGDFAADAILWSAKKALGEDKVDFALTNGGGIRASILPGDVTMKDMKTVFPFGNEVAVVTISGREVLEMLEAATYSTPEAIGAFPQVSNIKFTIDTNVAYEKGELYPNSTYYAPAKLGSRIKDVTINGQPLDLEKQYVVATNDFTAAGGDTYHVFKGKSVYKTGVALEDALVNYTKEELSGVISKARYENCAGNINILTADDLIDEEAPNTGTADNFDLYGLLAMISGLVLVLRKKVLIK